MTKGQLKKYINDVFFLIHEDDYIFPVLISPVVFLLKQ